MARHTRPRYLVGLIQFAATVIFIGGLLWILAGRT